MSADRVPQCGDADYVRCPECQASRYERHLNPCGLGRDETAAGGGSTGDFVADLPAPPSVALTPHERHVAELESHLGTTHGMDVDAVVALDGSWTALVRRHGEDHTHGFDHLHPELPDVFRWYRALTADIYVDDDGPADRSDWTASDYVVNAICRTVGCGSLLARWSHWPYRVVCNPLCLWLWRLEDRREARS